MDHPGAIYDPVADTWTNVPAPNGWQNTGDAQATNLANGTYMQASCCDYPPKWAYLNPTTLTWTNFQGDGKFDIFDEEGWNLLPNGKLLTVDAYVFQYDAAGMNSIVRSFQPYLVERWKYTRAALGQLRRCE